jgi:uncharacterized protein (TIGR02271 family)
MTQMDEPIQDQDQNREVAAGYFRSFKQAEKAVIALRQAGFAQIGVASRKSQDAEKLAEKTDAKAGLAVTAASGAVLEESGGESDYADPQDVEASLVAAHIPEIQARNFQQQLQDGGALVTVQTVAARAAEARRLLESEGAESASDSSAPADARVAEPAPSSATLPAETGSQRVIRLHGELLRVHKERVQRGEVRLRKEVVSEQQNMTVPVSHEEVVVERMPAAEGAPAANVSAGGIGSEAEEIRIPLSEERVSVEKQPVVTEQVRVGTREVQGAESVHEELKHEELNVESEGELTPEEQQELRARNQQPRRAA